MACNSMMSPKCTPLKNGGSALIWHKSVSDRNRLWTEELLSCLNQAGFQPARIIEFGCGIGTFLKVASEHGIKCEGWDIDTESIDYGKSVFGLDLMAEYLDPDKIVASKETILVSISVLEHIQNPRPTLKKIANFINRTGGAAYISVPFVTSAMLRDYSDGNIPCGAPPDVHVTLFSEQGFLKAFSDFGEFSYQKVKGGGWMGYLIRSNS